VPWSIPTFVGAHSPLPHSPYTLSSSSWNPEEEEEEGEREAKDEEEVSVEASYTSDDRETCDWDAPARIDWRQFHAQLLQIANDSHTKL
jgi:hypothetical protein